MTTSKKLIVKFSRAGNPGAQSERICELVGREFVRDARQVFPGETDEELATIFEVDLEDRASTKRAVESLTNDDEVEYAHTPQERKPM